MIRFESVYKKYKRGGFFASKTFDTLKDIDIEIKDGEHVGIIGESGAGKTTLGKLLSLVELHSAGSIYFDSIKINSKNRKTYRKQIGIVFQNPHTSFNPKITIMDSLLETKRNKEEIVKQCLALTLKEELLYKYPHQLSGGEQQRMAIARSVLSNPKYIIFDEATSALDVSTQAKIVNILCDINSDKKYSYIFITHDLKLAHFISDRVYVIYKGYIVEETDNIYKNHAHPYTKALLEGINQMRTAENALGCPFYDLCEYKKDICKKSIPPLKSIGKNKKVRCFLYD